MTELETELLGRLTATTEFLEGMSFTPPSLVVEVDRIIAHNRAAIAKADAAESNQQRKAAP